MTFKEACIYLDIEEYAERIFQSQSHGELFHVWDYITIAGMIPPEGVPAFRAWFVEMVEWAEKTWERPESVFQYTLKFMKGED